MTDERLMTTREVCAMLQVHEQTVRRWIKHEGLAAIKLGNRSGYRVRESDLMAFLEGRAIDGRDTGKAVPLAA